jgi:glycosyltransferase involved in cell wall biosynthesis
LIKAIEEFKEPNVRLIIFGSVSADMKKEFMSEITGNRITYIGWVDSSQVYRYFAISNLVVFPSKHSVLWEQAVGTGVPCIFRDWPGMKHVDVGGNCLFIGDGSVKQIAMAIERCFYDKELYDHMKDAATNRGIRLFSYSSIARRSIEG